MRREVERSSVVFRQSIMDMENIRTFREVLRHGGPTEEAKHGSSSSSQASLWDQPDDVL